MKKRFIVVAIIIACVIGSAIVALAVTMTRRNGSTVNASGLVVIIGAGMAGASAAAELKRSGQRFVIVEARSEVGGRMMNARFVNNTVELGANWIHEYRSGGEVEKLASSIKLNGVSTDFTNNAYYVNGSKVDATAEATLFRKSWSTAIPLAYNDAEQTVLNALSKHGGWKPKSAIDCAVLQFHVDYIFGLSAQRVSAYQAEIDMVDINGFDPSSERFVKDARGYNAIVKTLLERAGVIDTTNSSDVLMLKSNVTGVEYNSSVARVILGNGEELEARAVISTVSLGVLKSNTIQFKPELSAEKRGAMAKMTMGSYTKIFIQFTEPILTESDPLILVPTNCDRAANVQNLNRNPFFPGSNAVLVTVLGGEGVQGDALEIALNVMNQVVKRNVNKGMVSDFVLNNFDTDPYFRGAYSNRLVGFTKEDFEALVTPQQSLYLAGEMMAGEGEYGDVKSAMASGKRAAKLLMRNS